MSVNLPTHLTDPMVREYDRLCHGETRTIDALTSEVDKLKIDWLKSHPGWSFTTTALVRCEDGSPLPSYDVTLAFHRPRTAQEVDLQTKERAAFEERRKKEFLRREEEQKALLEEVLASIAKK